jgi:hypothetical protein
MNKTLKSFKPVILLGCFIATVLIFSACCSSRYGHGSIILVDWEIEFKSDITEQEKSKALTEVTKIILDYLDTAGSTQVASTAMSSPPPPAPAPGPGTSEPGSSILKNPCLNFTISNIPIDSKTGFSMIQGPCKVGVPPGKVKIVGPVIFPRDRILGIIRIVNLGRGRFTPEIR